MSPPGFEKSDNFIYFCSQTLQENFPSCLGWLDLGQILAPLSKEAKRVVLSPGDCSKCIPEVKEALEKRVKQIEELLSHFSKKKEILLKPFFLTSLSRREIFSFLWRETLKAAQKEITNFLNEEDNEREKLLLALKEMGELKKEKVKFAFLPWGELKVEAEKCDLCEVCSRLCPSNSLFLFQVGESVFLAQKPSRCLKCGLCVKVCPQKALRFEKETSLKLFIEEKEKILVKGVCKECVSCGNSFLGKLEEDTCINCRKLEDLRAEIKVNLGGKIATSKR